MSQVLDLRHFRGALGELPQRTRHETLWYEGNLELLQMPLASVVGTRQISPQGVLRTKRITTLLVSEGFCIVSGLARGVDRVAHEMALEMNGQTIAVMGTPIDECYPKEHKGLKDEISRRGLILSQFEPTTPIHRSNFPRRNVLMAALSSTTFVVEADIDSGTKHQVKAAVQMRKPVAFLASLVDQNYPWVREALDSGYGVVIEHAEDARILLRRANPERDQASRALATQEHFNLFKEFAAEPSVDLGGESFAHTEERIEVAAPTWEAQVIPEEDQAHLALVLPSPERKPTFWEKIYSCIFGFTPNREV